MQVPINSSVAGVIGLSNTRDTRLAATGQSLVSPANQTAMKPLEENTNIGDRDAQEQYLRDQNASSNRKQEQGDAPNPDNHSILELPADDQVENILDMKG